MPSKPSASIHRNNRYCALNILLLITGIDINVKVQVIGTPLQSRVSIGADPVEGAVFRVFQEGDFRVILGTFVGFYLFRKAWGTLDLKLDYFDGLKREILTVLKGLSPCTLIVLLHHTTNYPHDT
jgi:hypothetical protein